MRPLVAVAGVCAVLFAAGCGGGESDPLAPRQQTSAADRHAAGRIDLHASDLPSGYSAHGSQLEGRRQCSADLRGLTVTGEDRSRPFIAADRHSYAVGQVDVYSTRAQAEAAFRLVTGRKRRRCLLAAARDQLARFDSGSVRSEPLPLPVRPPAGRLLGRRFVAGWSSNGNHGIEVTDDVYLLADRTFVVLSFWHSGRSWGARDEGAVVGAVAARLVGGTRTRPGGNTTRGG